jgi:magnesium transporter
MLTFYEVLHGRLNPVPSTVIGPDVVWADLLSPTAEEESLLERQIGLDIPTRQEMQDIEASARLYEEKGILVMTADVVANAVGPEPTSEPVTFIITTDRLITVRYCQPRSFVLVLDNCARRPILHRDPWEVLVSLIEAVIERQAETLETVASDLDALSRRIFRNSARQGTRPDLKLVLEKIGQHHDLLSMVRISLISFGRMLDFLSQHGASHRPVEISGRFAAIRTDLASLSEFDGVLSAKLEFMLEATLGLISIEQNGIIKIISVVSVIFTPPTLIASIYGMNFQFMPELTWPSGYGYALILMLAAAVLPYLYFRWRRWL